MFLLALFLGLIRCENEEPINEQPTQTTESQIPTIPEGDVFHFQSFGKPDWDLTWTPTKLENYTGVWELRESAAPQAIPGEHMLYMTQASKYYGLSTQFDQPLVLTDKTLVLQYEVRLQDGLNCGGAYMKLFGKDNYSPDALCNETRYVIMFGPDKCGSTNKVHFIFRHKNPKNGVVEEKHMKDAPSIKSDKLTHLYTLIVRPDNTFEILIDAESVKQGNLLEDFSPSVNPPKEIDDPTDKKPEDWVDDEMMDDPNAVKPDDWDETQPEFVKDPAKLEPPEGWLVDEPKFINDPEAKKPEDWEDDIHGEWEAPTIPNPKCESAPGCGEYEPPLIKNELYKGKWVPPKIKNPAYKGVWKPRQIPNPDYFEDQHPHNFPDLVGAGFELWMVDKDIGYANVLITTDETVVHKWNKVHFIPKHKAQEEAEKKLEPEKKASTKSKSGEGFGNALKDFGTSISDAWMNLYTENQTLTIIITVVACLIPIILIFACCCRGSSAPAPAPAPAPKQKKVEEVKVEEEPEEGKEEEEEKEVTPEPAPEAPSEPQAKKNKKKKSQPDNF